MSGEGRWDVVEVYGRNTFVLGDVVYFRPSLHDPYQLSSMGPLILFALYVISYGGSVRRSSIFALRPGWHFREWHGLLSRWIETLPKTLIYLFDPFPAFLIAFAPSSHCLAAINVTSARNEKLLWRRWKASLRWRVCESSRPTDKARWPPDRAVRKQSDSLTGHIDLLVLISIWWSCTVVYARIPRSVFGASFY